MGLLDYYKQFEALSDEEVSEQLRARAEERRRRALARIDSLDLSKTTWHEFPHPDVVAAVTFAVRRGITQIALEDVRSAHRDLTHLARGRLLCVPVRGWRRLAMPTRL